MIKQFVVEALRGVVEEHLAATGSERARALLADFGRARERFAKVVAAG